MFVAFLLSVAFAPPAHRHRLDALPRAATSAPINIPIMGLTETSTPQNASQVSEAISGLVSKIAEYRSQPAGLGEDALAEKRAEIIQLYQDVFVPACAFALANLGAYLIVVGGTLAALKVSGIGYAQGLDMLQSATSSAPAWVEGTLSKIDPQLGDLAIALAAAELAGPAIVAVTIASTPAVSRSLRERLAAAGLDAAGASQRLEKFLADTRADG
mmetsp:Transcript_11659/g.30381  ORF Transcript_11659/g.30381 Transcript_11659/m.30381 type:complete len:215 (-) Transcript_11659:271-915(-)